MHRQLRLFLFAEGFYALAFGMLAPIYAVFVQRIGGDILEAGSAWAIFMIVSGIGLFFMGRQQDKISRDKLFLVIGYAMRSLGFLGYYFVSNITQMFMLQVLLGISVVIISPATYSFYSKHVDDKKRASEWAVWEGMWYIAQGSGALAGGFLAAVYGFRTLFVVMFIVSLLSMAIAIRLEDKPI